MNAQQFGYLDFLVGLLLMAGCAFFLLVVVGIVYEDLGGNVIQQEVLVQHKIYNEVPTRVSTIIGVKGQVQPIITPGYQERILEVVLPDGSEFMVHASAKAYLQAEPGERVLMYVRYGAVTKDPLSVSIEP